jgi:DNA-binding transcriptional LysR family regulator
MDSESISWNCLNVNEVYRGRRHLHLETLKTFCDLVETGSFSKAAALNLVSQSAVSQQVRSLERRYDQQLIERGGGRRGVTPTECGRLLYAESKELLERFNAVEDRLRSRSAAIAGSVRVATVYSVGLHELPPYVKQFLEKYPQVNVRVEYSRTNKVYEACLNNTIDFGIVAFPQRRSQIEVIPFRRDKLVLTCSPDHQLAKRKRVAFRMLENQPFVAFERDIPTRKAIDQIFRQHAISVNYVMEFDNIETIKRSVEAGIGISILPRTALVNEIRNGMLVALDFTDGEYMRLIGIIHRRGKVFSAAASEFVRLLTETSNEKEASSERVSNRERSAR